MNRYWKRGDNAVGFVGVLQAPLDNLITFAIVCRFWQIVIFRCKTIWSLSSLFWKRARKADFFAEHLPLYNDCTGVGVGFFVQTSKRVSCSHTKRRSYRTTGVLYLFKHVAQLVNKQTVCGPPTVQLLQCDNCRPYARSKWKQLKPFSNTTCATINAKAEPVSSETTTFSIKGSPCKTYSISVIQGGGPSKILPWPTGWETLPY